MNRYFYIICLKYVPAMWQHMSSFVCKLIERGYLPRLLISHDFNWMNEEYGDLTHYNYSNQSSMPFNKITSYIKFKKPFYSQIFQNYPPRAVLFVSWHTLNLPLIRLIKHSYPDAKIILWLHEPYKDHKLLYGPKAIIIWLIELLQTLTLRYTDVVVLHSLRALKLFNKRYPKFSGLKQMAPLQFQDHGSDIPKERRYITFLGRADRAKGIALFFALVEKLGEDNTNFHFQIATPSNIQFFLDKLSPKVRQKLQVINKEKLSDADLRQAAACSIVVLALYKETMQSGVIPIALMKGTPVIGSNIEGITEWIENKKTGIIVSTNPSVHEIKEAISFVQNNFSEMSNYSRQAYLHIFDDKNWERRYGWLDKLYIADKGMPDYGKNHPIL
jgi:glycosyltransferase involved in cell wall biosynthesis